MESWLKIFKSKTQAHTTGKVQGSLTYKRPSKRSLKEISKSLQLMMMRCKINLADHQISTASTLCFNHMILRKGAHRKYILKKTMRAQHLFRTECSLLSFKILAISIFRIHSASNSMTIRPPWKNRSLKWHLKYFKISRDLNSFS